MSGQIHTFDNGVKVIRRHLLPQQIARYAEQNLHEPDEEPIFIDLIQSVPPGGVFVSIGSAIGYYPILAKKLRSDLQIHCFEPLPQHLRCIRENMHLNQISDEDFGVHQVAVSSCVGSASFIDSSYGSKLFEPSAHDSLVVSVLKRLKLLVRRKLIVKTIDLASMGDKVGCAHVDLAQLDIQGAERSVLESYCGSSVAERVNIKAFLVGTHGESIHECCREMLKRAGYVILHDTPNAVNQPDGVLVAMSAAEALPLGSP
jgi:FkbM family methyltransferase